MDFQDYQGLQVPWATPDKRGKKDRKETQETTERRGYLASGVVRGLLGPEGSQGPQGLEKRVTKVLLEIPGLLVLRVTSAQSGLKARQELLDPLVLTVLRALKASVENQDQVDLKEREALMDLRESKVTMERKDLEVPQVNQGYQGHLDLLVRKGPKGLQGPQELTARKELEVIRVLLGYLGSGAQLDLQEMLVFQALLGFKDHQA